jgi:uncharacterized protein YvpB
MVLAEEVKKSPHRYDCPNNGFVGDMKIRANHGLGVYHKPIAELANQYLPGDIIDLTGCDFEDLFYFLDKGQPVWILTNSRYAVLPRSEFVTWDTPNGPVRVTFRMHSVTVVGYCEKYIHFHDPLTRAYRTQPRESFIAGWVQMGRQVIAMYKTRPLQ